MQIQAVGRDVTSVPVVAARSNPDPDAFATAFWSKLGRVARRAGGELVEKALWLYYAAQAPRTPAWARAVLLGALGYFLLPVDAIPDLVPVAGFTDDLGVVAAAVATVAFYIDDSVKRQASDKLAHWFGVQST